MVPSLRKILPLALLLLSGCGTFHNLKDPPNGPMFVGTGCTYPFGGVVRSGLLAVMGPPGGLAGIVSGNIAICRGEIGPGFQEIGHGVLLTSAGLVAIADTPLSLAGDIITLPAAHARSKEHPWATWWGEKSFHLPTTTTLLEPAADRDITPMDVSPALSN